MITRAGGAVKGKVGIVTGGGSGHLPVFTGYVGKGLLDAAAIGNVFASPSAEQMAVAMRRANGGAGVLRLYGNYGGDVMNFDMAGEMVELEDDISRPRCSSPTTSPRRRRKRPRSAAASPAWSTPSRSPAPAPRRWPTSPRSRGSAQKTADSCRSIGVALTPCTVPQAGKPTFEIGDDEMEMGMGIHGEPGIWRDKLRPADAIVDEMMDRLLADMPLKRGDRVSILVNCARRDAARGALHHVPPTRSRGSSDVGATIVMPLVGRYATSMEMTGATITLCKLDAELEKLLAAPCHCAFWTIC